MKKKIYISIVAASITVMLLMAFASVTIYYDFFENQVKSNIKIQAELVREGYENVADINDFLDTMKNDNNNVRISIIEPDGNVSFDTHANADYLNEHLDRPEIKLAINSGYGEAVRYSKTLGENTYYYALMLSDSNIVRLSSNTQSIMMVFSTVLPFILLLLVGILIVSLLVAKALTNRIVNPLVKLSDNLDDLSDDDNYDELNPFVEKIANQNATIKKQVETLKEERDTITVITDNMQEGLVLLGKERYVLSVNKSALTFLTNHNIDFVGQNFITLTRESVLISAADIALNGDANNGVIELNKKSYQYFANPVYEGEIVSGAILLIWDVTQKQQIEKIRQEFSANVSHELKTPLTTISGFAEMIQNDMVKNKEDLTSFAGLIFSESNRLLCLIDDIMRLSQIEEHKSKKSEQVNLFTVAKGVTASLSLKANKRGITMELIGKDCVVTGNETMLNELIYNLTDNAIKYNKKGGSVLVEIQKEKQGSGTITVTDTGIGVPIEQQDRIFERFYRVDKSRSKQTGGTGLGLSIVKHIVEFHGGNITLDSEENKGTKITVQI